MPDNPDLDKYNSKSKKYAHHRVLEFVNRFQKISDQDPQYILTCTNYHNPTLVCSFEQETG